MLQILPLFVRFSVTDIFKCLAVMKILSGFLLSINLDCPSSDLGNCLFNVPGGLCGQNFGSSMVGNTLLRARSGRLFKARVTLDAFFGDESSHIRGKCELRNHRSFGVKTIFTPNYVVFIFVQRLGQRGFFECLRVL